MNLAEAAKNASLHVAQSVFADAVVREIIQLPREHWSSTGDCIVARIQEALRETT